MFWNISKLFQKFPKHSKIFQNIFNFLQVKRLKNIFFGLNTQFLCVWNFFRMSNLFFDFVDKFLVYNLFIKKFYRFLYHIGKERYLLFLWKNKSFSVCLFSIFVEIFKHRILYTTHSFFIFT